MTPDDRLKIFCESMAVGFKTLEAEGEAAYPDNRDASIIEWVIRGLTFPELNDSQWVLDGIALHRAKQGEDT